MATKSDVLSHATVACALESLGRGVTPWYWIKHDNTQACMALIGILVIGPDSVLSGTIAQDIGKRAGLGGKAVGTLAGIVNSVGSSGAILQGIATAFISERYGWPALFAVFVVFAAISAGILTKVTRPTVTYLPTYLCHVHII